MVLLKIILEALKFGAIAIGTISGLIGTFTDTKDKTTGLPTLWGRRIVALIIVSGIIAIATQSIESYLKSRSDAVDRLQRVEASQKTASILSEATRASDTIADTRRRQEDLLKTLEANVEDTRKLRDKAESLSKGLEEQRGSIGKTAAGIQKTASDLRIILDSQNQTLATMYDLGHPLSNIFVYLTATYPLHIFETSWLDKVRSTLSKEDDKLVSLLLNVNSALLPREKTEPTAYLLLETPLIKIGFWKEPIRSRGIGLDQIEANESLYPQDLVLLVIKPRVLLSIDFENEIVTQEISGEAEKLVDNQRIASWKDLYGAQLRISPSVIAPPEIRIAYSRLNAFQPSRDMSLTGNGMPGAFTQQSISMNWSDSDKHINSTDGSVCYSTVLSESMLGPRPSILRRPI
jgi:hypothetical protein